VDLRVFELLRLEKQDFNSDWGMDSVYENLMLSAMEVHFTSEQQTRLDQVATRTGKNPEQLVREGLDRMLDYDENFLTAVEEGRAAARRGDLVGHEEVVERIEQLFRS
jgi:predicted transcriptional regulator